MAEEVVDITIGTGKDKIASIEETTDNVVINYSSKDQIRHIVVPRSIIDSVRKTIDRMEVGERYSSTYVFNAFIRTHKVRSEIIKDRMLILESVLKSHNINVVAVRNIINELEENGDFSLMTFNELIGLRKTETSLYFKIYGAIRYWKDKGIIDYNSKGSIYRLI